MQGLGTSAQQFPMSQGPLDPRDSPLSPAMAPEAPFLPLMILSPSCSLSGRKQAPPTPSFPTPTLSSLFSSCQLDWLWQDAPRADQGTQLENWVSGAVWNRNAPSPALPRPSPPHLLLPLLPDHCLLSLSPNGSKPPPPLAHRLFPQLWLPVEFTAWKKESWADSPETPSWPVPLSGPQFAHL